MDLFAERRGRFSAHLDGAVAVIPSAGMVTRSNDSEHEFRQHSDFYYLTGFDEPDAVLVLAPHHAERTVLFLRKRDREQETWTGRRLGVEAAPGALGVDAAYPIEDYAQRLPEYLVGAKTLYYAPGTDELRDRTVFSALAEARHRVRRGGIAPRAIIEPSTIVHEMRLIKSEHELDIMRRAGQITRAGHIAGMRATHPGMWEYELEAVIEYAYRMGGAQSPAYSSIVAGGDNATILHYNTNRDRLQAGTLVLVDSAAELDVYASDVTRTWPVSGRFSPEQRAIYEIVLRAQKAGIEEVRPGRTFDAYHNAAVDVLVDGLIDVGLLKGSRAEAIESGTYKDFYMHRTGHWIGLDVHDVGRYTNDDGSYRPLEPGMVMTVEPGLYIPRDLDVPEAFKGIGVRIEDDILCTNGAPENLTPGIPKEIDEIEALVGSEMVAVTR